MTTNQSVDFNAIVSEFAAGQLAASRISQAAEQRTCGDVFYEECAGCGILHYPQEQHKPLICVMQSGHPGDCSTVAPEVFGWAEECHPEPTIADFERAVYEAKVKGGKA